MKKIAFSLLLVSSATLLQAQFNTDKDPFITKPLTNESFRKVNASTSHGNISVATVPAAEARIEVFIRANGGKIEKISKEEIQSRLDAYYTLEVSVSGGELTAVAKTKTNFNNWKRALSISFRIYTAQPVSNRLKTSHGNIDLSGMSGDQDLGTSHGNIHIENTTGKLNGETSHGNITITGASDNIDLSTSHGNITAANCEGSIKLITSNGDVGLNKVKGKIRAGTSHGNISGDTIEGELSASTSHGNVNMADLNASVDASTNHGNISLQLPRGKGLDIDLRGKNIRLEKLENFSGSKEEHSMKGTLNGGGTIVKANTGQGTVSLEFK